MFPRLVLGSLTPGAVYLFTMKGPSRKSHSRRKMLKAGPKYNKVCHHGRKHTIRPMLSIDNQQLLSPMG